VRHLPRIAPDVQKWAKPASAIMRRFGRHYKHEAQANECFTSRHTRSRFVLVFSAIHAKMALSSYGPISGGLP
jgi:hypothetical protein